MPSGNTAVTSLSARLLPTFWFCTVQVTVCPAFACCGQLMEGTAIGSCSVPLTTPSVGPYGAPARSVQVRDHG